MRKTLGTMLLVWGLALVGCGGDDDEPDAEPIALFDAATPDAGVPDAFVCTQTECGAACVDTTTNPLHCGGCSMACTPVQDCAASDCECPGNFVPTTVTPIFSQMDATMAAPDIVGLSVFAGTDGGAHIALAIFSLDVATGVDIDLTDVDAPAILLGYDLDIMAMSARGGYAATSGTVNLDYACAEGVAGTVTGAGLEEGDLFSGTLITDGCVLSDVGFSFTAGVPCAPGVDAGSPDV